MRFYKTREVIDESPALGGGVWQVIVPRRGARPITRWGSLDLIVGSGRTYKTVSEALAHAAIDGVVMIQPGHKESFK